MKTRSMLLHLYIFVVVSYYGYVMKDISLLADYMQRVDLIQDLRFETATTRIKVTPDGEYLIASGDYLQFETSLFLLYHQLIYLDNFCFP